MTTVLVPTGNIAKNNLPSVCRGNLGGIGWSTAPCAMVLLGSAAEHGGCASCRSMDVDLTEQLLRRNPPRDAAQQAAAAATGGTAPAPWQVPTMAVDTMRTIVAGVSVRPALRLHTAEAIG